MRGGVGECYYGTGLFMRCLFKEKSVKPREKLLICKRITVENTLKGKERSEGKIQGKG